MTCSWLTEHRSSEWTLTPPCACSLGWLQCPLSWEVCAKQSGLSALWLLILLAVLFPGCRNDCFSSASWGHLSLTHPRPFLWIQVCSGIPPLCHLPFYTLCRWKPECRAASSSLSTIQSSRWGGAVFVLRPMFPHRKLVTLFLCSRKEKLRDGKLVGGDMLFQLILSGYLICRDREQYFIAVQFLWLLDTGSGVKDGI